MAFFGSSIALHIVVVQATMAGDYSGPSVHCVLLNYGKLNFIKVNIVKVMVFPNVKCECYVT